jgi:uncharacterized protein Yka (UPF0111/DUF47 family)
MRARIPWFTRHHVDILELLRAQAATTLDGIDAFADWSRSGHEQAAQRVRDCEHAGDAARRAVLEALTTALLMRIEQEDAYALSERLDEVLDLAKDTVRTAQALTWQPDEHAAAMGAQIHESVAHLRDAIDKLGDRRASPGDDVERGIKSARQVEKCLRAGLAALLQREEDSLQLIATLEIYRSYSAVGAALLRVADRTWYAALRVL